MRKHREKATFYTLLRNRRTKPASSWTRASPSRVSFPDERGGGGGWTCLDSRGLRRCTQISSSISTFSWRVLILVDSVEEFSCFWKNRVVKPKTASNQFPVSYLHNLFWVKLHASLRNPWLKIIWTFPHVSRGSNSCTRPQPSARSPTFTLKERRRKKCVTGHGQPRFLDRTKK